jgi:hypothetical protein
VSALAKGEVGKFINRHFVSSFQRVGTFRINQGRKQGGNVASYFCAPDGRVLHAIAGPVEAKALLEEARWVVEKTKDALERSKGDASKFKAIMRRHHAERLKDKYDVQVTAVVKDHALQDLTTASAYRDAKGRRLAPVLSLPPIEGEEKRQPQTNGAKVHRLLAAHAMLKIPDLYGAVFQGILGETVTTKPVEADSPFAARKKD